MKPPRDRPTASHDPGCILSTFICDGHTGDPNGLYGFHMYFPAPQRYTSGERLMPF